MPEISDPPYLPIGYWSKKVDEALTFRMDEALQADGLSRTEWQLLNMLHELGSAYRDQLTAPMHPFADAIELRDAMLHLAERERIEGDGSAASPYRLTAQGRQTRAAALAVQQGLRQRSLEGIGESDQLTALRVLQRLVQNLQIDT